MKVPALSELGLPVEVGNLAGLRRGLVLIGGAAGAGKSTTLAALVNEINLRDARHIVTIEDPVEYEHAHVRSVIDQVEVGTDAPDFPTALRAALRQAPDILSSARCAIRRAWLLQFLLPRLGTCALDAAHHRRRFGDFSYLRFVPSGTAEHDSSGTGDGDLRGVDSDIIAEPQEQSRAYSGGRAVDDWIWGAQHIRHNALNI